MAKAGLIPGLLDTTHLWRGFSNSKITCSASSVWPALDFCDDGARQPFDKWRKACLHKSSADVPRNTSTSNPGLPAESCTLLLQRHSASILVDTNIQNPQP